MKYIHCNPSGLFLHLHNVQRYNIFCTFKIHFTINKIYIKYIEKLEEINLSTWINTFLLRFWTQDANVLVPSRYSLGWAHNGAGDLPGGISPLCPYQALTNLFTPSFYFYIIFSNLLGGKYLSIVGFKVESSKSLNIGNTERCSKRCRNFFFFFFFFFFSNSFAFLLEI